MIDPHRKNLLTLILFAQHANHILFSQVLKIGWEEELTHLHDAYEEGDIVNITYGFLESLEDSNVQYILPIVKALDYCAKGLMEMNDVTEEELEHEFDSDSFYN